MGTEGSQEPTKNNKSGDLIGVTAYKELIIDD